MEVEQSAWQSSSQKLLIDLVGQPSLLTPVAFAEGFLKLFLVMWTRANFIKHGYKEALEEGLKEECEDGGRELWGCDGGQVSENRFPEGPEH